MHLQAMGPVQALLPLLYECQTGCCGSRWQWTVNSTRTYVLKMYCWQHISCKLSMRASVKHFGVVTVTMGQVADSGKKVAFITRYISCRE